MGPIMDCCTLLHWRRFLWFLPLLTGCGMGTLSSTDASVSGSFSISGIVHGGQQPVSSSTIQLYTAGKTGNGSAATPMLTTTVTTSSNGTFTITGDYSCVNTTDQVYISATGGNPGLTSGTNNNALVLLAAIGNCSNLTNGSITNLDLDEVTTVAAVYALAPFIGSSYTNIGATSTNTTGLANAFLDAQLLANITNGTAATLTSGLTIQSGKLYALADAISYCVNSSGSTSAACTSLVSAATPSSGVAPASNTLATTLSIVQHPGDTKIVGPVFNLVNSQAPYTTTLTQAPNDWTMTLSITNGGLSSPTALDVDASGNVWVADYTGSLSGFSPQGAAFSSAGFGSGTLAECYGLTIDTSGNIWVTNFQAPNGYGSVTKFLGTSSGSPGSIVTNTANSSYYFYDSSISFPAAVAADTNGNIGIANSASSSATIYSSSGALVTTGLASGNSADPVAIAFDSSHGLWLANHGDGTATHVSSAGTILAHPSCCNGADGIALDSTGNAWITNYSGGYVVALSSSGVSKSLVDGGTDGGISSGYPIGIAIDAAQNVWVTDYRGTAITELAGNSGTLPAGAALSPANGYGLDANLLLPYAIVPDASGNVWVSDFGNNKVVMFFGLATPTVTPIQPVPTAP